MPNRAMTNPQVLVVLAASPPRIAELTAGLTPEQLRAAPAPGEWSAVDILAHLRSCADVWGQCIAMILAEDAPTIRAVNPTTWVSRTDYREQQFQPSRAAFEVQRAALLATLEPLTPDDWLRTATVTGAGKALERTVRFYAEWLATHERSHLRPIERIVRARR